MCVMLWFSGIGFGLHVRLYQCERDGVSDFEYLTLTPASPSPFPLFFPNRPLAPRSGWGGECDGDV